MNRKQAIPYVSYIIDDAGSGRELNDDIHAIIRESGSIHEYSSILVGWQCGFEPLFLAVHSHLDCRLDDDEAEEMARDYLAEREWFSGEPTEADYIIR